MILWNLMYEHIINQICMDVDWAVRIKINMMINNSLLLICGRTLVEISKVQFFN